MKLNPINRPLEKFRAGLMYLGIITIITIVIWISVGIYTAYSKPSIDPNIQAVIKPINPSLDSQVLINYSTTRIKPPDQFQIISVLKEGNQITQVLLDPFGIASPQPRVIEPPLLSETASSSSKPIPAE